MINIWIQEQENSYQVSPLIYDIGEKNLSTEVIQNVHLAVAKSILSGKRIDQISASRGITSFIKGGDYNNAGIILLNVYQSAKNKEEIDSLQSWGYLNFWSDLDIPRDMSVVLRAYIRNEQIIINRIIGNDTTKFYNRLEEYTLEDSLETSERLWIHFIILSNFETSNLSHYWKHLDYILSNWKHIDESYKEVINTEMFSGLLWIPIMNLVDEEVISLWLHYVSLLETEFKIDFFDNEIAQAEITIISSNIANSENQQKEKDWNLIKSNLNILTQFFSSKNLELLEAVVLKEIIAIEFNVFKNQLKAKELTLSAEKKARLNETKYLLYENIGKLFFNEKHLEESKLWLFRALEIDCISQTNYIDTLIYGASAISNDDSKKAIALCEKAVELSSTRDEFLELDHIQILGELGIAYWIDNNYEKSFETFEDVVNRLLKIRFYPEFNGMITFEQKDVYRKSFHKTAPIGGWMDS